MGFDAKRRSSTRNDFRFRSFYYGTVLGQSDKGPAPEDCWFWVGAISDDGYGRFTLNKNGTTRAVRPHRYAYYLATGVWLDDMPSLMHACDEPTCVHATADPSSRLMPGTHRENMLDRIKKMRHNNGTGLRYWGVGRAAQADRSRRIREELLSHGWNSERIAAIRFNHDPDTPTLF